MVAPFLVLALFGIVEFGLMFSNLMQLNNVTREGARVACVGARPSEIVARMMGSAGRLDPQLLTITMQYRELNGGYWTSWMTIGDDGTRNTATPGSQIRIRTEYQHELIIGGLFGRFGDEGNTNMKTLRSSAVMRRE